MCGIAGYSLFEASAPQPSFPISVVKTLNHRGPDDEGYFVDESSRTCLVHTRLSIIDATEAGHQPMSSADGHVVLIFNGELYNYRELRDELESNNFSFSGNSDTEVLLNLYLKMRSEEILKSDDNSLVKLLRSLNGIFAFSIWDADRQQILLARDSFGVKPLYYRQDDNGFFFASEIKALPSSPSSLNPVALDKYLTYLWCPGEGTPIHEVRKFAPGEAMWIDHGEIKDHFYWNELPALNRSSIQPVSKKQAIQGTESHLRKAVHRQMVADDPVGAFLSGGLDSSSVVAFAREINPQISCFTIAIKGFDKEGFADDLPYARRVATHLKVPLQVVNVDASEFVSGIDEMVWQLDEPLADLAPLNVLFISRLARKQGLKVLLSGAGGDDIFTGYRRHLAFRNERFWQWLPRPIRVQLRNITGQFSSSYPLTRRLRKAFSGAHLDGDARLVHYFRWIDRADLFDLYTPEFRAALGETMSEEPMLDFLSGLPKDSNCLERLLALEKRFFLVDHNLTYTDKMSMAAGVEVRVPFLDVDLVNFAGSIPADYKQKGRIGKWVLKKAMEPYLPNDVIYRPKTGFGAPIRHWLKSELREWLADVLSIERLQKRGLFDPRSVQRLIVDNADGRLDASYTLLSLACIEIWCTHFIDNGSVLKKPV